MDKQEMLAEVKRSIGFRETEVDWDIRILDFINRISQQLKVMLGFIDEIPEELEYIIIESTIARFNRLGNEGMSSYAQEGESISYSDILGNYASDIRAWKRENGDPESFGGDGKAFFV